MIYFEPDFVGNTYNLNHPRVLWNSITRRGTVAASSDADGFAAVNAATATTYDAWMPTGPTATWTLTFDAQETVSAVALAAHDLGTTGSHVTVQRWGGAAWVDLMPSVSPTDDAPIAFLFGARDLSSLRIAVAGGSSAPKIGVIHISEAMELPQPVYMGAPVPIDMSIMTEYQTNRSAGGQYLGRSILRRKSMNDFLATYLRENWVRDNFMPFVLDAREYPYFLLERPYDCPNALSYRWRDEDIKPQRMGVQSFMQVAL